jgi:hypothetical protein
MQPTWWSPCRRWHPPLLRGCVSAPAAEVQSSSSSAVLGLSFYSLATLSFLSTKEKKSFLHTAIVNLDVSGSSQVCSVNNFTVTMDQISFASRPWIWSVNIFTATMGQISFASRPWIVYAWTSRPQHTWRWIHGYSNKVVLWLWDGI